MGSDRERARKLRDKAADKAVTPQEAEALIAKAVELEKKLPQAAEPGRISIISFALQGVWPVIVIDLNGVDLDAVIERDFLWDVAPRFTDDYDE